MKTHRKQLPFVIALVLGILPIAGCVPDFDVVWLPDSSGFVFIRDNALVLYDLERRAERTIVEADWLEELELGRPAVSPDGKLFALIRCEATRTMYEYQVMVFDGAGGLASESPGLTLERETEGDSSTKCGYAEWSSDGRHIIFLVGGECGVFDRTTNTIEIMSGVTIAAVGCCLPSGRGFLASRGSGDQTELVIADWDGWVYQLSGANISQIDQDKPDQFSIEMNCVWDGDTATITLVNGHQLIINADARSCRVSRDDSLIEYARRNNSEDAFHVGENTMLSVSGDCLEVFQSDAGRSRVLVDGIRYQIDGVDYRSAVAYCRAPDGAHTIVVHDHRDHPELIIVDTNGRVVTRMPH